MNLLKIYFHVNNKLIKKINNDNDELQKINEKNNKKLLFRFVDFFKDKMTFSRTSLNYFYIFNFSFNIKIQKSKKR